MTTSVTLTLDTEALEALSHMLRHSAIYTYPFVPQPAEEAALGRVVKVVSDALYAVHPYFI